MLSCHRKNTCDIILINLVYQKLVKNRLQNSLFKCKNQVDLNEKKGVKTVYLLTHVFLKSVFVIVEEQNKDLNSYSKNAIV